MAKYPPAAGPQFRGVRASTTITYPTQTFNSTGKVVQQLASSKAQFQQRRLRATAADLVNGEGHLDVSRIVRLINDLQEQIEKASAGSRTNPLGAPCIVRGVATTSGVPVGIPHTLGRPWTDFWCVRQAPASPAFTYVTINPTAYPTGHTPDRIIYITPNVTGTYDFAIAGD